MSSGSWLDEFNSQESSTQDVDNPVEKPVQDSDTLKDKEDMSQGVGKMFHVKRPGVKEELGGLYPRVSSAQDVDNPVEEKQSADDSDESPIGDSLNNESNLSNNGKEDSHVKPMSGIMRPVSPKDKNTPGKLLRPVKNASSTDVDNPVEKPVKMEEAQKQEVFSYDNDDSRGRWKVGYSRKHERYAAYHSNNPKVKALGDTPEVALKKLQNYYRSKGVNPSEMNTVVDNPVEEPVKVEEAKNPVSDDSLRVDGNPFEYSQPVDVSVDKKPEMVEVREDNNDKVEVSTQGGFEEFKQSIPQGVDDVVDKVSEDTIMVSEGSSQGVDNPVDVSQENAGKKSNGKKTEPYIKPTRVSEGSLLPEESNKARKDKRKAESNPGSTGRKNKKRWERKGFRLKDTDKELLDIASRYRFMTTRVAAKYLDASHDTARRRIRKLKEVNLFTSLQVSPHQTLWLPTASGLELINAPYKPIDKHQLGLAHLAHENGILHLGVDLETANDNPLGEPLSLQYKHVDLANPTGKKIKGNNTITVRQIRSSKHWWEQTYGSEENIIANIEKAKELWQLNPNQQTPELHPDNAVMWITYDGKAHIPDLVVARDRNPDGSPASIAIELELSEKPAGEWERILNGFKNSWQYDKLYYLTPYEKIAKKLRRINDNKVGIPDDKFIILRYMSTNGTPSGYTPFQI